jgi:hypothetical protein
MAAIRLKEVGVLAQQAERGCASQPQLCLYEDWVIRAERCVIVPMMIISFCGWSLEASLPF